MATADQTETKMAASLAVKDWEVQFRFNVTVKTTDIWPLFIFIY